MSSLTETELEARRSLNVRPFNMNTKDNTTVCTTKCGITNLVINDALAKTIKFYDGSTIGARLVATLDAPAKGVYTLGWGFDNGLTVSCVSATVMTLGLIT